LGRVRTIGAPNHTCLCVFTAWIPPPLQRVPATGRPSGRGTDGARRIAVRCWRLRNRRRTVITNRTIRPTHGPSPMLRIAGRLFFVAAPRAIWPIRNGGNEVILYFLAFLYLAVSGPGTWSLDHSLEEPRAELAGPSVRGKT